MREFKPNTKVRLYSLFLLALIVVYIFLTMPHRMEAGSEALKSSLVSVETTLPPSAPADR